VILSANNKTLTGLQKTDYITCPKPLTGLRGEGEGKREGLTEERIGTWEGIRDR